MDTDWCSSKLPGRGLRHEIFLAHFTELYDMHRRSAQCIDIIHNQHRTEHYRHPRNPLVHSNNYNSTMGNHYHDFDWSLILLLLSYELYNCDDMYLNIHSS